MKKIYYFICFFACIIVIIGFLSFSGNKESKPPGDSTINCEVASDESVAFNAMPFVNESKYAPTAVTIRKNVYSLTPSELNSIKTGIAAMKALPMSNPTSWRYQAAIHGTNVTPSLTSWSTCQHNNQFFLSWHRMYLYFFERILRKKSGNPNLTLPYWNYQTNPVLHPDYRNNVATNPLYDATRFASINAGGSLPAAPMVAITNALNLVPFLSFQSNLESPHGSIHGAIGGDMTLFSTAGLDPVFWLHHTNIDRLWEAWLKKCGGRANPTTAPWTTQNFTFFDENGIAVIMTGSQVVNTATQLNYRYDVPALSIPCQLIAVPFINLRKAQLLAIPGNFKINQSMSKLMLSQARIDSSDSFIKREKNDKFKFTNTASSDRLTLQLEDIQISKFPEGVVEIYLNLPDNEVPKPDSKYYVGVLDLFTSASAMHHDGSKALSVDASQVAQSLGLKVSDLNKGRLSFFVRGNTVQGKEVATTADINIRSMNFAVERANQ